jgi:hypothetical protein
MIGRINNMEQQFAGFKVGERRKMIDRREFTNLDGEVNYVALMNKFDEVGERLLEESRLLRRH